MTSNNKSKLLHPALPLLLGLITTQIIATIQVYLSNLNLYTSLIMIEQAGYLTVPNQNVMPALKELAPALYGGFFFTLSIGAGLTLFTAAAAWFWVRLFSRNRHVLTLLAVVWAALVLLVNINGINVWATLHFFLTPLIVFNTTIRLLPESGPGDNAIKALAHLLPVILLAILWTTQYDRHLFLDLRDYLLFSNPVGKKVSEFYYSYSPYATEAFKSINQKTLKTCRLPQLPDQRAIRSLKLALVALDYLPVVTKAPVDLEMVQEDNRLLMKHDGRVIVKTTVGDLLNNSKQLLSQFSSQTDRFAVFRQLTFFAILLGYPLTLYILFHGLFWIFIRHFTDRRKAAVIASIICLLVSLVIFMAFSFSRSSTNDKNKLAGMLNSDSWQERVAALRFIEAQGLEIGNYSGHLKSLSSPKVPERYWLAKAMSQSKISGTHDALILLLDDPHVNVESMAFLALARRGDRRALPKIRIALKNSGKWYSQIYAYNALRTLGWKQKQSH
jgi:hypothetical protein